MAEAARRATGSFAGTGLCGVALSKAEAQVCQDLLWKDHVARAKLSHLEAMKSKSIKFGDFEMKFDYKIFGKTPEGRLCSYISMHGGGGAPKRVNDQQWENREKTLRAQGRCLPRPTSSYRTPGTCGIKVTWIRCWIS